MALEVIYPTRDEGWADALACKAGRLAASQVIAGKGRPAARGSTPTGTRQQERRQADTGGGRADLREQ